MHWKLLYTSHFKKSVYKRVSHKLLYVQQIKWQLICVFHCVCKSRIHDKDETWIENKNSFFSLEGIYRFLLFFLFLKLIAINEAYDDNGLEGFNTHLVCVYLIFQFSANKCIAVLLVEAALPGRIIIFVSVYFTVYAWVTLYK